VKKLIFLCILLLSSCIPIPAQNIVTCISDAWRTYDIKVSTQERINLSDISLTETTFMFSQDRLLIAGDQESNTGKISYNYGLPLFRSPAYTDEIFCSLINPKGDTINVCIDYSVDKVPNVRLSPSKNTKVDTMSVVTYRLTDLCLSYKWQ